MANLVYPGLGSNILRMWLGPDKDLALLQFYRDRIVPEAKLKGVTIFLLAPSKGEQKPNNYTDWGNSVADYVKWAKDNGLEITTTGMNNEPSLCTCDPNGWQFSGINTAVKAMRSRLDSYGLNSVGIIAPEGANADNWLYDSFVALKNDPQAWNSLQGVASHSYSNATREEHGAFALAGGREYWMTESSDNGQENAADPVHPYQSVARYLNDLNHGITHWVWFIGYYRNVSTEGDGKTKLVNYDPTTDIVTAWPKYWYYRHVNSVFSKGTVLRRSTSPTAGNMNRSDSDISNVNVAVGKRTDGKLVAAITSAINQPVTLNLAELAGSGNISFAVIKSSLGNYQQPFGAVTAVNGNMTIQMAANQLVTLTQSAGSPGVGTAIPVKIQAESYSAMNGVVVEPTGDTGGGSNVGYVDSGDWMEYTINAPAAGNYTLDLRVAATVANTQMRIRSGAALLSTVTVPNTGAWQAYQTVSTTVALSAGVQTIRILCTVQNWNLNWLEFKAAATTVPVSGISLTPATLALRAGQTTPLSTTVLPSNASNKTLSYSSSNTSIATVSASGVVIAVAAGSTTITAQTQDGNRTATANVTVSTPVSIRIEAENFSLMSGIQTEPTADIGGGLNVSNVDQYDWLHYLVTVPTAGVYTLNLRVASMMPNTQMQIRNGDTVLANVTVPNTGGWQTYQTVSTTVTLSAGTQTIGILATLAPWNFNWLEVRN